MSQIWKNDQVIGVTRVGISSCTVVQVKNDKKDGYSALQIGCGKKKAKHINKPQQGHYQDLDNFSVLKEFRIEAKDAENFKRGDVIGLKTFVSGDKVKITGISKGKGFQGVVKRHHFSGHKRTHGNKDQERTSGSVGAKGPARVFKGVRMGGRTGGDQITTANVEIIGIDEENSAILLKGSVPGARNGLVFISGEGDLQLINTPVQNENSAEEAKNENIKEDSADTVEEKTDIVIENTEK
jgi:large subunit ribosomal protein L3